MAGDLHQSITPLGTKTGWFKAVVMEEALPDLGRGPRGDEDMAGWVGFAAFCS